MSDHQQATPIRQPNGDVAMLLDGVVRVRGRGAEEIAQHGSSLIKGYLVLAEILCRFTRTPLELHAPSVASPTGVCQWNGLAMLVLTGRFAAKGSLQTHGTKNVPWLPGRSD